MNDTLRRATSRLLVLPLAALSIAACSSNAGLVPDQPVRMASGDAPVNGGW